MIPGSRIEIYRLISGALEKSGVKDSVDKGVNNVIEESMTRGRLSLPRAIANFVYQEGIRLGEKFETILHLPHAEAEVAVLRIRDILAVGTVFAHHAVVVRQCALRDAVVQFPELSKERP